MKLVKPIARALGAAACMLAAGAATAQIPIEDLARSPAISQVTMSADGDYLVGLITPPGEGKDADQGLAVWDLTTGEGPTITPSNNRMKFIYATALKSGKLFAAARQEWTGPAGRCGMEGSRVGNTATFITKLYMTSTAMQDFEEPFAASGSHNTRGVSGAMEECFEILGTASLYQDLPLDPHDVIAVRQNETTLVSEYLRVDLQTGEEQTIYRQTSLDSPGIFDPRTGELLTKSRWEPKGGGEYEFYILIRNGQTGEFEVHDALTTNSTDRGSVSIAGWDEATGKYYVITDQMSGDHAQAYMYDPKTRKYDPEPIFATKGFDVTGIILGNTEEDFNELLGFRYGAATQITYYVDPEWNSIQKGLEAAYPDTNIRIIDYTDDKSKILFSTSSSIQPPVYYLLKDKSNPQLVGAERPWIDSDQLRQTELVYYEARDGMRIPAFLTLPKSWNEGDAPLPSIVLPHGGPWARDSANWDASGWPQFLASRGYAVLQPEYRGSTGWGRKLWMAGDAQWGLKMQDDNDDAAGWLAAQGYADPNRVAIFGYSYGGFAAMAATVRENGPFRCAIAGAGVSNLTRIGRNWSGNRLQRALQGKTVKGMDPMQNTDKANIPILIYAGNRDTRVPLFHSRDFYNAVKDEVNAKFMVIDDMPHSLPWYPRQHRETLTAIQNFLANDCAMKPGA